MCAGFVLSVQPMKTGSKNIKHTLEAAAAAAAAVEAA